MTGIDWLSNAIILPEVHAGLGAAATLGAYLLIPGFRPFEPDRTGPAYHRVAVLGFIVIVLLKELFWDPVNEMDNPFLWQGVIDLGWYLVGVAVALGLILLRYRRL